MKTSELLKLLKKNGCYLVHNGTRHDIWCSPRTNKQFTIPRHKDDVKPGTLNNILKDASLK